MLLPAGCWGVDCCGVGGVGEDEGVGVLAGAGFVVVVDVIVGVEMVPLPEAMVGAISLFSNSLRSRDAVSS